MTESPAATLRCAAEKLRELAQAAEPSPWRVELRDGDVDVLGPSPYWIGSFGHETSSQAHRDAAYVAAMHPGVALVIADWLANSEADYPKYGPDVCAQCGEECCDHLDDCNCHHGNAYTVARAFLGEAG